MRCPHCAGEVLDGSRFCGICGREIASAPARPAPVQHPAPPAPGHAVAPAPGRSPGDRPASGHPLPPALSPGSRRARILAILALDLVLAGVGLVMILSHIRSCTSARSAPAISSDHEPPGAPKAGK